MPNLQVYTVDKMAISISDSRRIRAEGMTRNELSEVYRG